MTQSSSAAGLTGIFNPADAGSQFNAIRLLVRAMISRMATTTMVQIVACTNDGGLSPAGTVDIMPLPNQIDGNGNAVPHGVIYGCPYMRVQGGANGIIIDPVVGDIGFAVFASRDLSSVIATKAQANPASRRQYDWADGLYVGGLLNAAPTQYVQFDATGITVYSPTNVTVVAPNITLEGPTTITGTLTVAGAAVLSGGGALTGTFAVNGVEMDQNHTHHYGGSNTGPVNP